MLKRDNSGWLLAILGLLLGATFLIYAVTQSAELRSRSPKLKPDQKIDHLTASLKSIPDIEMGAVFRKSGLPTSDISCEIVVFSEGLIYLDFSDTDIVHSMNGEALKKELVYRIELAKEAKGFPTKKVCLILHDLEKQYKPKQDVKIDLTLLGPGTKTLTGQRASLVVRWGAFKVPWQKRSVVEPPADEELKTIVAGEERRLSLTIPAPEKPGEYSLYAVFDLYANESGEVWVTESAYSDTKVLQVVK